MVDIETLFDDAESMKEANPTKALAAYTQIVFADVEGEELMKMKETSIKTVGELHAKNGDVKAIREFLHSLRPQFSSMPKAKTAKIVRTLMEAMATIPNSEQAQIDLCLESIEWTKTEKRTFLRHRLETKLASLYVDTKQYNEALKVINPLLIELKRLDDKALLVEVQLLESRTYQPLKNLAKARAALTSARTSANSIYCPPPLQAQIDLQAGVVTAEEKEYKTAFSYFLEAFESYATFDDTLAIQCLKYLLLSKIMMNNTSEIQAILNGKTALKYLGADAGIEAMREIAQAHQKRSLKLFEEVVARHQKELKADVVIDTHLSALYDNLLEQNLCRLIEPFSKVEISHIAKLIELDVSTVQKKLSQMILDKKFDGILDQGAGCLIVYESNKSDEMFDAALSTIKNMNDVVDSLYKKASKLG